MPFRITTKNVLQFTIRQRTAASAKKNTHVQYTQTDTIRQTDGPLILIENDVIPMVLLVNIHLIKGT